MNLVGEQGSTVWRHIHWYTKDGTLSDIKRSPTFLSDTLYPTPIQVFKLFQQRSMVWVPATEDACWLAGTFFVNCFTGVSRYGSQQRTWLAAPHPPPDITNGTSSTSMEHHLQTASPLVYNQQWTWLAPPHPPHPPRYPPWNIIHKTTSPFVCNQQRTWLPPQRYHKWNIIYKTTSEHHLKNIILPKKSSKTHENARKHTGGYGTGANYRTLHKPPFLNPALVCRITFTTASDSW